MSGASRTRLRAYQVNYDQIARDHIAHWRKTGKNPFQEDGVLAHNENATVEIARQYLESDAKILDAGCGMGDLMLRLRDYDICGVDISADYLEIAKERGLRVQKSRIEKLPFPRESFDAVLATDVLEHVLDLNKAVRELLRVLKVGGIIIVRTPNEEKLAYDTDPYEFVHLRRFDHPTFHLLFRKIFGCEILEVSVSGEVIHAVARK